MNSRVKILCSGIVQGIGFRPFVFRIAIENNVYGFVRNQGDAGVYIVAEGKRNDLENFIKDLNEKKPYLAKYERFQVFWESYNNEFNVFSIIKSSDSGLGGISYLPPDISICDDCLNDIANSKDLRFNYPFTSCAICGPRYTTITDLPYDRPNTTMNEFPLCSSCQKEFENPLDRRYHAQTTCCLHCGPKLSLYTNTGEKVETSDLYNDVAKIIEEGSIIAIKGIGGTHIACSASLDETILRVRTKKGKRKYKPFALMSKNLDEIKSFAFINNIEKTFLTSFRKPIVLLRKKEPFPLSEWISPKLFNVGVMLPYSGIHSLILNHISDPAIILTSANPSDLPMFIDNNEILSHAKNLSDYILLHNRTIHQRADDSVLRITNGNPVLIRRSRGWVPEPINLPFNLKEVTSLGVGPLLTSTGAIALKDRCFPTQYIGDINTIETLDFLENSINHLARLLNVEKYDTIGHDLHPSFLANTLAEKAAKNNEADLYGIQHHHAHAIALMIDNGINLEEDIITIIADGVGFGEDGKIWGGEIFDTNYTKYKRIGHLEEQPMIGGDRATYYPIRMFAGIISKKISIDDLTKLLNETYLDSFHSISEIQVLLVQLKSKLNIAYTTSTGRILASISALLKACSERTYEGEPAIVLESLAFSGKTGIVKFSLPEPKNNIIDTTSLVEQSYELYKKGSNPADIALEVHKTLASQFAQIAIDYAKENNIKKIGFTGGVAYNQFITENIAKAVRRNKLAFITHKSLPCGDGAISTGQAIYAALKKNDR